MNDEHVGDPRIGTHDDPYPQTSGPVAIEPDLAGMSIAGAAEVLGCTPANVYWHISKGNLKVHKRTLNGHLMISTEQLVPMMQARLRKLERLDEWASTRLT